MNKFYQSEFRTKLNAKAERRLMTIFFIILLVAFGVASRMDYAMQLYK